MCACQDKNGFYSTAFGTSPDGVRIQNIIGFDFKTSCESSLVTMIAQFKSVSKSDGFFLLICPSFCSLNKTHQIDALKWANVTICQLCNMWNQRWIFLLKQGQVSLLDFFSSCSYIQIRCFVQKYWSGTVTRNTDMWIQWYVLE